MVETYSQYLTIDQVRREIVRATGRYDLVSITSENYYCNNGIDLYIHQGQRALERRLNVFPTYAKWWYTIDNGVWFCEIENLRAVQECYVLNNAGTLNQKLIKLDHKFFEEETNLKPFVDPNNYGQPLYYYPDGFRTGWPNTLSKMLNDFSAEFGAAELVTRLNLSEGGMDPKIKGVVVWPPPDQEYTIEIRGLYYDAFPQDTCEGEGGGGGGGLDSPRYGMYVEYSNYWMQEYPNLLIMASIQQLDYMYRGRSAARKWEELIELELRNIEKDAVEEEVANVSKMEG